MPKNTAAWLVKTKFPLEESGAPYTPPDQNEIVVRNHAVAVNPFDWINQYATGVSAGWIKYPFILGSDVAGEVVEVGAGVTRFKAGDRVLGHALGVDKKRNRAAEGAFQQHTILLAHMAAPIPDTLSYEDACVLPLGLSTAACGLFQKDQLALRHPTLTPERTGKTLLVWGGSTSVGSNAVQLAVAAGYEVIATASPRNFDYVKSLGAVQVFNYNSSTVVQELMEAFAGRTIAGAISVGPTSLHACLDVVAGSKGDKFVSIAAFPLSFQRMARGSSFPAEFIRQAPKLFSFGTALLKARLQGIRTNTIYGTTLVENEVSRIVYGDFLPKALAVGRYTAAPPPLVVGRGLSSIQHALEVQLNGLSASKAVVSL